MEDVAIDIIDLQNRKFDNRFKEVIGKIIIIGSASCDFCNRMSVELFCINNRKIKFSVATSENTKIHLVSGMDLLKKVSRKENAVMSH